MYPAVFPVDPVALSILSLAVALCCGLFVLALLAVVKVCDWLHQWLHPHPWEYTTEDASATEDAEDADGRRPDAPTAESPIVPIVSTPPITPAPTFRSLVLPPMGVGPTPLLPRGGEWVKPPAPTPGQGSGRYGRYSPWVGTRPISGVLVDTAQLAELYPVIPRGWLN